MNLDQKVTIISQFIEPGNRFSIPAKLGEPAREKRNQKEGKIPRPTHKGS